MNGSQCDGVVVQTGEEGLKWSLLLQVSLWNDLLSTDAGVRILLRPQRNHCTYVHRITCSSNGYWVNWERHTRATGGRLCLCTPEGLGFVGICTWVPGADWLHLQGVGERITVHKYPMQIDWICRTWEKAWIVALSHPRNLSSRYRRPWVSFLYIDSPSAVTGWGDLGWDTAMSQSTIYPRRDQSWPPVEVHGNQSMAIVHTE